MELVKVNDKEIIKNEFKEQRILTIWDIAKLHERKPREVTQNFKYNFRRFKVNVDYYYLTRKDFLKTFKGFKNNIPNNVKFIYLFKADGYLKLIKSFNELNLSLKNIDKIYKSLGGKKDINILAPNTRFEISFKNVLIEALKELSINVEHQIYVNGYRLDFYIFEFNLVIEYDEYYHKYSKEKDKIREKEIKEKLGNDCKFLRLDYKDSDIKNLMKVLQCIYDEEL